MWYFSLCISAVAGGVRKGRFSALHSHIAEEFSRVGRKESFIQLKQKGNQVVYWFWNWFRTSGVPKQLTVSMSLLMWINCHSSVALCITYTFGRCSANLTKDAGFCPLYYRFSCKAKDVEQQCSLCVPGSKPSFQW